MVLEICERTLGNKNTLWLLRSSLSQSLALFSFLSLYCFYFCYFTHPLCEVIVLEWISSLVYLLEDFGITKMPVCSAAGERTQ